MVLLLKLTTLQVTGSNYFTLKFDILIESYRFTDKSFDNNNIANYHLSLQVYPKGFSFCILDRSRNKYIALSHYYYNKIKSYNILLSEIEDIFNNSTELQHNYQHIKLMFATPKATMVPSSYYEEGAGEDFFKFNHELSKGEIIQTNFIYGNESEIIYCIPEAISAFFKSKYHNVTIYHQACPFIEEIILKNKSQNNLRSVFLNIYQAFFDVAWIDNAELKLFNSFAYTNNNDFQYFLLNVFEQLKLSAVDIPVVITGLVQKNDSRIEIVKRYFKYVNFMEHPDHFEYSYGFNEYPNHFFTNMLNLYQCG